MVLLPVGPALLWMKPGLDARWHAVLLAASYALYSIACHWRWGRTLGKQMYGLSVIRENGARSGRLRLVLRELGRSVYLALLFAPLILPSFLWAAAVRSDWAGSDEFFFTYRAATSLAALYLLLAAPTISMPVSFPLILSGRGIHDLITGSKVVEDVAGDDAALRVARGRRMAILFGLAPLVLVIASLAPGRLAFAIMLLACLGVWLYVRRRRRRRRASLG